MKIAAATPSRGLIHSRTADAVMRNAESLRGHGHEWAGWVFTHDLPIPAAHNRVAELALATGADYVWFIEEDMVPPDGALLRLIQELERDSRNAMACLDYPVGSPPFDNCVCHKPEFGIWWAGLGCNLIRRTVLEQIAPPWFKSDKQILITRFGTSGITSVQERDLPYEYGGQDIYFGMLVTGKGWLIVEVPPDEMICGHANLIERGPAKVNHGYHTVEVWNSIGKWH